MKGIKGIKGIQGIIGIKGVKAMKCIKGIESTKGICFESHSLLYSKPRGYRSTALSHS